MRLINFYFRWLSLSSIVILSSCSDYYKKDYKDNTPTSGKLKLQYDEGLHLHAVNQALTFEAQYRHVEMELYPTSENEAVVSLLNDSCESIMISRQLGENEMKAFSSKKYEPKHLDVARSGVAIITNLNTSVNNLSLEQIKELLVNGTAVTDSTGKPLEVKVMFDRKNSSVLHYMLDSVCKAKKLSPNCNILSSTLESINYVANYSNTIAFIDFAWLSDADDSISKANVQKIKFLGITNKAGDKAELPSQSTFKLGTYPFTRTIYIIRKTGEFTLAKGFQSYVAGAKGQLTFLKQGLLPTRQAERRIKAKMEDPEIVEEE